eukprot:gene8993-biopygen141
MRVHWSCPGLKCSPGLLCHLVPDLGRSRCSGGGVVNHHPRGLSPALPRSPASVWGRGPIIHLQPANCSGPLLNCLLMSDCPPVCCARRRRRRWCAERRRGGSATPRRRTACGRRTTSTPAKGGQGKGASCFIIAAQSLEDNRGLDPTLCKTARHANTAAIEDTCTKKPSSHERPRPPARRSKSCVMEGSRFGTPPDRTHMLPPPPPYCLTARRGINFLLATLVPEGAPSSIVRCRHRHRSVSRRGAASSSSWPPSSPRAPHTNVNILVVDREVHQRERRVRANSAHPRGGL